MKRITFITILSILTVSVGLAQMTIPRAILADSTSGGSSQPPSNSVTYMKIEQGVLWTGTSNGLARTTDYGNTWQLFRENSAFANRGIFSMTVSGSSIWAATGYEHEIDGGSVQTGSGFAYSLDNGVSWEHCPQPLDSVNANIMSYGITDTVRILPILVPQQNVTFDISLTPTSVWIASWSSGLRRSTDNGATWERILLPLDNRGSLHPEDTLWTYAPGDTLHLRKIWPSYDPRSDNNLLAFSVYAASEETIWCGTAGGINKSTDGGWSWVKFNHQNQRRPILGNWVIAIDEQKVGGKSYIWTTNWKASDNAEDFGISYSENGGLAWKNLLHGVKAYDFAFKDSIVYVATDNGIYRTEDFGVTFQKFSSFVDSIPRTYIPSAKVYSVSVVDDTVYIGTDDGLVKTIDNDFHPFGSTWKTYRAYQPLGVSMSSYAYPNPFSPPVDHIVRIHYGAKDFSAPASSVRSISIEIFDFAMNRVRTLLTGATRSSSQEFDETWDGRDNDGSIVPNGVYFYRLVIDDGEPLFGKILVMQ